jgi:LemA protein
MDFITFSATQLTALALGAVLLFWMVGGRNRLVGLRNRIAQAWLQVDEGLKSRGDAVPPLVVALRPHLPGEQGALDTLLGAERQVRAAADALAQRPTDAALAAALVAAETAMGSATSRVLSLVELHLELRHDPAIAPHAEALRDSGPRLAFARQLYNEAALAYTEAVQLFPTKLLAELFRFSPAGRL